MPISNTLVWSYKASIKATNERWAKSLSRPVPLIDDFDDFLVIDVDLANNALMGRPLMYKNASILQCVKYPLCGGQGTIAVNKDPFLDSEAYHAEACFYKPSDKGMAEDEYTLTARASKPPLVELSKAVIQLDYGVVETYHRFEVPK